MDISGYQERKKNLFLALNAEVHTGIRKGKSRMKKYKLFYVLVVILVVCFVLMSVSCDNAPKGSLKIKVIDSNTLDVYYSYSNASLPYLYGVGDAIPLDSDSNSGVHRWSNLSPNVSYDFVLYDNQPGTGGPLAQIVGIIKSK